MPAGQPSAVKLCARRVAPLPGLEAASSCPKPWGCGITAIPVILMSPQVCCSGTACTTRCSGMTGLRSACTRSPTLSVGDCTPSSTTGCSNWRVQALRRRWAAPPAPALRPCAAPLPAAGAPRRATGLQAPTPPPWPACPPRVVESGAPQPRRPESVELKHPELPGPLFLAGIAALTQPGAARRPEGTELLGRLVIPALQVEPHSCSIRLHAQPQGLYPCPTE